MNFLNKFLSDQQNKDIDFDKIGKDLDRAKKEKRKKTKFNSRIIGSLLFFVFVLTACQKGITYDFMDKVIGITTVVSIILGISSGVVSIMGKYRNYHLLKTSENSFYFNQEINNAIKKAEEHKQNGQIGLSNADYEQAIRLLQNNKLDITTNGKKIYQIMHILANQYCEIKEYNRAEYYFNNAIDLLNKN